MLWTSPVPEDQKQTCPEEGKNNTIIIKMVLKDSQQILSGENQFEKPKSPNRYLNLIVMWKSPSFPFFNPVKSGLLGFLGPGRALSSSPSKRTLKL